VAQRLQYVAVVLARPSQLVTDVIGCAIRVHRALGPGLLESAYGACLVYALSQKQISFRQQMPIPVVFEGVKLDCGYRADLLIEGELLVELKSVEQLLPIHQAQMLTYLKLLDLKQGLLMNFNVTRLTHGLRNVLR
jgi:GxxExxY protein